MLDVGCWLIRRLAILVALGSVCVAQGLDPVKWSLKVDAPSAAPGSKVAAHLIATIEPGWHLYSLSTPAPSRPSRIQLADNPVFEKFAIYFQEPTRSLHKN